MFTIGMLPTWLPPWRSSRSTLSEVVAENACTCSCVHLTTSTCFLASQVPSIPLQKNSSFSSQGTWRTSNDDGCFTQIMMNHRSVDVLTMRSEGAFSTKRRAAKAPSSRSLPRAWGTWRS